MKKWLIVTLALAGVSGLLILSVPLMHVLQEDSRKRFAAENPMTSDTLYIAINRVRADNRLPQFKRNHLLDDSAKMKCDDMVKNDYYDHENPKTGKSGYMYIADTVGSADFASENLNSGTFYLAEEVVSSWMGSPSHAASILDPSFTEIGFATCEIKSLPNATVVVQHKIDPTD